MTPTPLSLTLIISSHLRSYQALRGYSNSDMAHLLGVTRGKYESLPLGGTIAKGKKVWIPDLMFIATAATVLKCEPYSMLVPLHADGQADLLNMTEGEMWASMHEMVHTFGDKLRALYQRRSG